jgi:hypothetical protein
LAPGRRGRRARVNSFTTVQAAEARLNIVAAAGPGPSGHAPRGRGDPAAAGARLRVTVQ